MKKVMQRPDLWALLEEIQEKSGKYAKIRIREPVSSPKKLADMPYGAVFIRGAADLSQDAVGFAGKVVALLEYSVLAVAAFFAGALNTVAGGGTFLTFPALVYIGVPAVTANATSAVSVFPGYLGGAIGFRNEIAAFDRRKLRKIVGVTVVGGLIGSLLLLVSSNEAFSLVVPFLLAFATLAFAFGERFQASLKTSLSGDVSGPIGLFLVSVYGGYFNGGLGIMLLALFSLWGMRDLNAMNGLKNGLSFILSAISVGTFALAGIVAWPQAAVMMVAATLGGYAGAPLARALPREMVRAIVILVGTVMSGVFFARLWH